MRYTLLLDNIIQPNSKYQVIKYRSEYTIQDGQDLVKPQYHRTHHDGQ